ncbi:hypothetical protein AVEN_35262-1 [Araneus ventricosus]|uniref:Reverse transcriptase domain-containing protein n=1 Tax=Araneus ventricosus TaxID=182803 RepID=A0A4Y2EEN1_ARAVE|nr:hypothetical protein AVEN_35262-1 [Araneus ventricosus]
MPVFTFNGSLRLGRILQQSLFQNLNQTLIFLLTGGLSHFPIPYIKFLQKSLLVVCRIGQRSTMPSPHAKRGLLRLMGCSNAILFCKHVSITHKKDLSVAWLDVTNAFGALPHQLIYKALAAAGTGDQFINIIQDLNIGQNVLQKSFQQISFCAKQRS